MFGRSKKVQDDLREVVGLLEVHHVAGAGECDAANIRNRRSERVHNVVNFGKVTRANDHKCRRTDELCVAARRRIGYAFQVAMTD